MGSRDAGPRRRVRMLGNRGKAVKIESKPHKRTRSAFTGTSIESTEKEGYLEQGVGAVEDFWVKFRGFGVEVPAAATV